MDDHDVVSFDRKVTEARQAAGLTPEEVAGRAGMHPDHYRRIENGRLDPRLSSVVRITRALGIRLAEFIDDVDVVAPYRQSTRAPAPPEDGDWWPDVE